jgi:hypothetical protein
VVAVIEIAVLRCGHSMPVLLWQDLSILDRLDGAVVMVLVDLFVDGSIDILMPGRLDCLVFYGRSNLLMDGSIVMSSLGHVVGSLLDLVHDNGARKWIWDEVWNRPGLGKTMVGWDVEEKILLIAAGERDYIPWRKPLPA